LEDRQHWKKHTLTNYPLLVALSGSSRRKILAEALGRRAFEISELRELLGNAIPTQRQMTPENLIESFQTRCMLAGYNDIPRISSHHATRVAAHPGFTTCGDNGQHNVRYKSGRFS
jgi:hypothetical protein